jgi:hypothetical protein
MLAIYAPATVVRARCDAFGGNFATQSRDGGGGVNVNVPQGIEARQQPAIRRWFSR